MNLSKLRYVLAVDRAGAISAAARDLHITQSAVTKAVADIEAELGFAIFERRARGVVATVAGRGFIDRAARILSDMDQLVTDARTGRETRDRVLRIGIAPPSLEGLMNRAAQHLVMHHPEVRLHLRGVTFETGMQLLRQGDLDALIAPEHGLMGEAGFAMEPLPPLRARMYGRKGHPLTGAQVSAADLAKYPIISPDLSGAHVRPLIGVLEHLEGDPVRGLHIIENFPMASGIIERTDALGVVVASFVQSQAFRSRFEVIDFDMGAPLPMVMAVRKETRPARAMGWLRAALKAHPPTADHSFAGMS